MQLEPVEASEAAAPDVTATPVASAADADPGPSAETKSRKISDFFPFRAFGHWRKKVTFWWKVVEMPLPTSFQRYTPDIHERVPAEVDSRTRARNALGAVLREHGKLNEAMAELAENIELEPRNAEAHHEFALVLRDQEKPDEAIAELRKAIKLESSAPGPHFDLASILRDKGRLDESVAEFRETIKFAPNGARAYHELALVLYNQNMPDQAVSELQKAIKSSQTNPSRIFGCHSSEPGQS